MAPPVLGIDLGTTNSAVAVATSNGARALRDEDGRSLIPSVVSFHPTGKVVVGYPARERRLNDARNTVYSVKRLIGRPYNSSEVRRARDRFAFELGEGENGSTVVKTRAGSFALQEISAFVLRRVREVAEHALGMPCASAVVTVPANFNELQRSATKAAGRIAGLDIKRILNEPTAAALAYGYGTGVKEKIAIYDLGGGTFDITILDLAGDAFEVLSTAGDTFLGGDDLDLLVAERMAQQFLEQHRYDLRTDAQGFERLRAAGEWVKCELSRVQEAHARVEEVAYDVGGTPLALDFKLWRMEFERMVTSMLGRTFDVCEEAMKIAGIRPTQLDNVILVGGSTRIPIVQRMVREYFGREPMSRIDPDLVVAQGAAIQAMALGGDEDLPTISPRTVARVPLKRTWVAPGSLPPPAGPAFAPLEEDNFTPGFTPAHARTYTDDELSTDVTFDEETSQDHDESEEFPTKSRIESPVERPEQPAQFGRSLRPVPRDWRPPRPNEAGGEEPATMPRAAAAVDAMYPPIGADVANDLTDAPTKARAPTADAILEQAASAKQGVSPILGVAPISVSEANSDVADVPTKSAPAAPPLAETQQPGTGPADARRNARLPLPDLTNAGSQPPRAMNRPPLLLDVTPLSLGIETVGGYCEHIISRNAAIPAEETRIFTTSRDDQDEVQVRISQGESRRLDDNLVLGEISLSRLRRAARGVVKIAVTFILDADGTLGVRAKDLETGRVEEVRVRLVGGLAREEEARLAARHAQMMQ